MKNQPNISTLLAVIFTLALAAPASAEQVPPISREVATQLIADFYEIGQKEIAIAYIIHGSRKSGDIFANSVAEATYLRRVVADGGRKRRIQCITFQHDFSLGWFLKEQVEENGRTYIDICSELQGRIRVD